MRKTILKLKNIFYLTFFVSLLFFPCKSNAMWELTFKPPMEVVKTIGMYKEKIFIGSNDGVFVSSDGGMSFKDFGSQNLSKDKDGNVGVNWIYIDEDEKKIYIATNISAYVSPLTKPKWEKIFSSNISEITIVNSVNVIDNEIFLSTANGLWVCSAESEICTQKNIGIRSDIDLNNPRVNYTAKIKDKFYLLASSGVYVLNKKNDSWEEKINGIKRLTSGNIDAKHLYVDKENVLWLACGTGVYKSSDSGETWQEKSSGIGNNVEGFKESFFINEGFDSICAASVDGLYCFSNEIWKNYTQGIMTVNGFKKVYSIQNINHNYFLASDEGLFKYKNPDIVLNDPPLLLKGKVEKEFADLEELEPSVIEVQKQALKFASLPTHKDYKRYAFQMRARNVLPRIGFDLGDSNTKNNFLQNDKDLSTDISFNNEFASGRSTKSERDLRTFKQASVEWNTGGIIYDNEIKEILSQARLTANIRENLLDDVTRIYYQRRKLQLENILNPPTLISEKLSNNLYIAELTGQLDSRTGGWFSRELENRKRL